MPRAYFTRGNTFSSGRPRKPGNALGEILDGLLKEKHWTTRDLEELTRQDEFEGAISHQYVCLIIRGDRSPKEETLNRLLRPFGYTATQELRVEPIEKTEGNR
jgi:transcriptional regulator with XRE-family HTH domain